MVKTKKISFAAIAFILAALIAILPLFSVNAAASSNIYEGVMTRSGTYSAALLDADFYDSSNGCLTQSQESEILKLMQETADKVECNIGIAIVSDLHGMSDVKYAETFGDVQFGVGSSFIVLLLLNTHDNPQYKSYQDQITRSGLACDYYDAHVKKIFNKMYDGLDSQGFAGACRNFCSALKTYRSSGGYSTGGTIHLDMGLILFMLIGSVVMSIIIVSSVQRGYKKKTPISAAHYLDKSRTHINRQIDQFVREYTTSVHLNSSSSSGGGHHSSGGSHRSGGHHSSGGRHR